MSITPSQLWFSALALALCAVNYYIGKARGAAEERDRWMRRNEWELPIQNKEKTK